MRRMPRIPEITQRDRFIRRVTSTKKVFAVAGEDGLARVPSQQVEERDVTLLWSKQVEAERWADIVADNPRVKELTLGDVLADILPALTPLNRSVGLDWNSDPIEGEFSAEDVAERLRSEALEGFCTKVREGGRLYILEDSNGPAMLDSPSDEQKLFLPCWSELEQAEARIEGPWSDMLALEIPLPNFLGLTVPWLVEREFMAGPDHEPGARTLELDPTDLAARLADPEAAASAA